MPLNKAIIYAYITGYALFDEAIMHAKRVLWCRKRKDYIRFTGTREYYIHGYPWTYGAPLGPKTMTKQLFPGCGRRLGPTRRCLAWQTDPVLPFFPPKSAPHPEPAQLTHQSISHPAAMDDERQLLLVQLDDIVYN